MVGVTVEKMKKCLLFLMLLVSPLVLTAGNSSKAAKADRIVRLVNEYRGYDGFEVVRLGALPTSLLKGVAKIAMSADDDPEVREMYKLIKGIRKLTVVEFEECDSSVSASFCRKMDRILDGVDLLMEVKDGGDHFSMYGVVSGDGAEVRDFILYSPEDCVLICLFGTISMDNVYKMMES